ncbi:MAG: hypothetical protein ACLFNQ_12760 [Spirochaetaceae bacterium]
MKYQKTALLSGAVTLVLLMSACSQAVFQSDTPAYPTFNLVGAPTDRNVTYELNITGDGMTPITRTGIGPTSGSLTLEVPAGRDRTFELLAENDVYSGITTTSLAGGRENRVTLPILPGPVFVDFDGGTEEPGPRLFQIRDLGVPSSSVTDEDDNRGREVFLSEFTPVDVAYGATSGLLYVLDEFAGQIATLDDLSDSENIDNLDGPDEIISNPLLLDVNEAAGTVVLMTFNAFYTNDIQDPGVWTESSFESGSDAPPTGVAISDDGFLYVVADIYVFEDDVEVSGPALLRINPDVPEDRQYVTLPGTQSVPGYSAFSGPPTWGDVRIIDDRVYVISAVAGEGNPAVYQYDLDLDLVAEWGTTTTASEPEDGEFWGPRRFVATRRDDELIVIDQKDNFEEPLDGSGRLVRFEFGTTDGWQTFGEGEFGFFDTSVS